MTKKKKRRRAKRRVRVDRILILLGILLLIILAIWFGLSRLFSNTSSKDDKGNPMIVDKKNDKEKTTSVSLVMVGDNLIHSSIYKDANANANYDGYDFKPMYSYLKEVVSNYDLAYYNQETILGGSEIGLSDYPTFNSPQEVGDAMIDAGFNLVSLATNHTMDRGEKAITKSCEYWNSHKDEVLSAGSYCSEEERNEIKIKEKNGIKYTMLSYTYGTNGIPVPKGKEYLVNVWPTDLDINDVERDTDYQAYKEQVKKDIEAVRDKVDVLMVAMHWGVEYTHTPTEYEVDMANYLASLGVDIVIGSHPHVVQPVTWIDDTLVIYSLGNMLSAQETDLDYAKMVGLMSSVKITKTTKGNESKITLSDVNNDLLFTYFQGYRKYKVVPFSSSDIGNYLSDAKRLYDKYSAVIKRMDDSMPVMALGE